MSPYRTNAGGTPSHDATGRKIETLECTVDDVEVEFYLEGPNHQLSIVSEKIEGDQSYEDIREEDRTPCKYFRFKDGSERLQASLHDAGKEGYLWINDNLCVPWSRVFSVRIKNKFTRKVRLRYVLKYVE